jgi:catechol 2,3-dioxygenase-like lactoylglutathione lyase family enzyme
MEDIEMLGKAHPITDVCITCRDLERSISFYRDKLGFQLRRSAEGFADFGSEKVTLALWEIGHIAQHVGFQDPGNTDGIHKVMVASEVPDKKDVDSIFEELSKKGVSFQAPPKVYPWNAYCCYFQDPDGNLWEIYTWIGEGPEGYHEVHE